MVKGFLNTVLFFVVTLIIVSCANRGMPSGGEKDTEPPRILKSVPENYSTNFKSKIIKIYFDEYIKINDVQKQLIISPPMDNTPEISPMSSASKVISITIKDTLKANTTYAFNFGESIVDNNEGNPYPYYRYVFSTGNYIDSLSVKGYVMDAIQKKPDEYILVMLYEIDSTYSDSIVYKEKPKYITNTLDSVTTFSIDNLKAGKYMMVALKDENANYTFEPKYDKIGFVEHPIVVPTDSVFGIKLFQEELRFRAFKPKQIAGQKIAFGYEGNKDDVEIHAIGQLPKDYKYRITKNKDTDTLHYWYKPELKQDSIFFAVKNKTYVDTLKHRFVKLEKDSLIIKAINAGNIDFTEDFKVEANIPFEKIDPSKIRLIDKDSAEVAFTTAYDSLSNTVSFKFDKTEANQYKMHLFPEAFQDFFGNVNDTLDFTLRTKNFSDYGNVRVVLKNAKYPVIVQLTNSNGEVLYEQYAKTPQPFDFRYIKPSEYFLRVVYDTNENGVWDTGNYLKKIQPERISYSPQSIEVRAGWDWIEEFTLE